MLDITKFSFKEALNNSRGKSSIGLFLGLIWGLFAVLLGLLGVFLVYKGITGSNDVFVLSGLFLGTSGTTIGIRRFSPDKNSMTGSIETKTEITQEIKQETN